MLLLLLAKPLLLLTLAHACPRLLALAHASVARASRLPTPAHSCSPLLTPHSGQVEVELTLDVPDLKEKKIRGKHPKKTIPAGKLVGQILFEGRLPQFNQIGGGLVERKPGVTYLAVRLNSATKLNAADPNGSSDPFVTVDWDGAQQTSRVIVRTLEPVWRQTVYFPLKLVTINKQALATKPPVSIRVFDLDEAGHDLLGSCEVPLHKITSAEHAKIDDEVGPDGRGHKGRVLKLPAQQLVLEGHKIQSTINIQLYFAPDLPLDLILDEEAERRAQTLSEDYMQRLKTFWPSLPARIRRVLTDQLRDELSRPADFDFGFEHFKRIISAEDQDGTEHFFSEYLCPQQPPSEMKTPEQVARMVRCVTWATDTEVFNKDSRRDVWQSPTFFLEIRKGDFEDHALLMCNLLLGLGMDAYVCVGRLKGANEGEKRHVWVMTREPDDTVKMWETSRGDFVELPNRWQAPTVLASEQADHAAMTAAATKGKSGFGDVGKLAVGGVGKLGVGAGKLGMKAGGKMVNVVKGAVAGKEAEGGAAGSSGAGFLEGGGEDMRLLAGASGGDDEALLDLANDLMREDGDELLTKEQVEESLVEVLWEGSDEPSSSGGGGAQAAAAAKSKEEADALADLKRSDAAERDYNDEQLNSDLGGPLPQCPPLLYEIVEVVFNHKNLWVSNTVLDPEKIMYDFDDKKLWTTFLEPRQMQPSQTAPKGLPCAFYVPKRLGAKVAAERLRSMEAQIEGELKTQIKLARSSGLTTTINKSAELVDTLKHGLELQEKATMGDAQARNDLMTWEKRQVRDKLPAGSTFKARPFHFAYTDAKKIRKTLLSQCPYAEETGDGTEFAVAVKVFAFHGGICSVWVYFGLIDTNLLN